MASRVILTLVVDEEYADGLRQHLLAEALDSDICGVADYLVRNNITLDEISVTVQKSRV